ncbi:MOG protein, partial [Polypterus senegalus]
MILLLGFSVFGSDEPLVAALGEDIILPCNVDTPVPLEELELEWIKKDTSSLVHLSIAGEDQPESQHKSYRNRTQIFHENLLIGDYSLKLKKTEVQDEGKYRCVVHSRTQSEEVVVELKSVERLFVTGTNGPLFVYAGGEIVLNCFVDTHIPIEKLEVQWVKTEDGSETLVHLFVEGEDQPESQNQLYKGRTELSNESLADGNFSLKLKSVGIKDKGIYKCKVHTNTESAETTIELDVGVDCLSGCETACQLLRLSPDLLSYVHFQVLHAPCIGLFKMLHHHSRLTRYSGSCGIDEVMDSLILIDEGAGNVINLYF